MAGRALAHRIKGANGLQRVAEKIKPGGLVSSGGEDVDHAAANGELAPLGNRRSADIAIDRKIALDGGHGHVLADAGREAGGLESAAGRRSLQKAGGGGDHQKRRPVAGRAGGKLAKGRHPRRRRGRAGSHPVVGQAVPAGQTQHGEVRRKEGERIAKGVGSGGVARNKKGDAAPGFGDIGADQGVKALRRAAQGQMSRRAGKLAKAGQKG